MTIPRSAHAATVTWDGGGGDTNWTTANNWSTNAAWVATNDASFDFAFVTGSAVNLNGNQTVNSLAFTTATDFSLNNNTLTLANGDIIRSSASGTTTINSNVALGRAAAWDISGNLTANGAISGSQTLTKNGTGTLTLTHANTYTGDTTLLQGILNLQSSGALGATPGNTVINANGELQLQNDITVGPGKTLLLTGTGAGGTGSAALRNISGNNSWSDTITLKNITGVVRINSDVGTLTLGAITETGSNNKILTLGGAGEISITGIIFGSAGDTSINTDGTGIFTLSGKNTYTGTTTISAGTLSANNIVVSGKNSNIGNAISAVRLGTATTQGTLSYTGTTATYTRGFTLGAGGGGLNTTTSGHTLTVGTGAVTGTGTFTVGGDGNTTITSNLTHTGGVTKNGVGTLTLSSTGNTYTGTTTVSAGALALAGSGTLGSGSDIIVSADGSSATIAILDLNGVNATIGNLTLGGPGPGAAKTNTVQTGAGTLTLGGNVLFRGDQGNQGANSITGKLALGSGTRTFTINGTSASELVVAAVISGNAGLIKDGDGILTLAGANTFTGTTDLNASILALANAGALGTGSITYGGTNGGSLRYSSSNTVDYSIRVVNSSTDIDIDTNGQDVTWASAVASSNSGGLTKRGAGTFTLTGNNAYTGTTSILDGTLAINSATSLGTGSGPTGGITLGGGSLRSIGGTYALAAGSAIELTANGTILADSGTLTLAGPITNAGNLLTFGGAGNITSTGTISGTGGLTKTGTDTARLDGANTYSGATTVAAGTLIVDGSITSSVTVNSGGTLGGSGSITGNVTIDSGGTHAPGTGPGIETITGDLTYSAGSAFEWELTANTSTQSVAAPHVFDQVNVGGNLAIDANAVFKIVLDLAPASSVDFSNSFWAAPQSWQVFDMTGSTTGTFSNALIQVSLDSVGGNCVDSIAYPSSGFTYSGGNLYWNPVPEPANALVGLLLCAGLLRRRRK